MAFKDTYRLEKVYYENIWTLLKLLKNVDKNNVDIGTVKELLDNAIADNESIIIIYKNLGELYAELQNQHMELGKELEKLKDSLEEFKDEINDKIDENHNYIMGLIREIEQRLDDLENRVEELEERMTQAETDIDSLEGRMTTAEGDIDNLETAVNGLHDDLTALEGRVDTAEGDIDNLEQNKQDKLTAGSGITIDPDTNEISNTAQGKIYTAGSGIAIDPDTNEISATIEGASFPAGTSAEITRFSALSPTYFESDYTNEVVHNIGRRRSGSPKGVSIPIPSEKLKGIGFTFNVNNIGSGMTFSDTLIIFTDVCLGLTIRGLKNGVNYSLPMSIDLKHISKVTGSQSTGAASFGTLDAERKYFDLSGFDSISQITISRFDILVDVGSYSIPTNYPAWLVNIVSGEAIFFKLT